MEEKKFKFYTCRYDTAFKEVFMDEKDTSLLKVLLEFLLKIKINKIDIKNNELNNDNVHVRRKLVDVLVDTDQGIFNIEVNTSSDSYIKNRNFSFIANAYSKYTLKGDKYNPNIKFIQINLSYGLTYKDAYRIYRMCDNKNNTFIDNFLIYEFNMDYYLKLWYNKDEKEIENNKYLIMLDLGKDDLNILSKKDKVVSSFMDKLNMINEDPIFQSYISAEQDDRMIINSIKSEYREKGREEGLEIGREDRNKELITSFYNKGYTVEQISEMLDLDVDFINKVIK